MGAPGQRCGAGPDQRRGVRHHANDSRLAAEFPFDADARARKWNLWGYIDARDGAQAVQRALENAPTGFDRFIIAAADTVTTRPNAELVAEVFPGVETRGDLDGTGTLLSIVKARRLLGYDPQHSWRDHR